MIRGMSKKASGNGGPIMNNRLRTLEASSWGFIGHMNMPQGEKFHSKELNFANVGFPNFTTSQNPFFI